MIILVLFYTVILVNLTFSYIIGPLEDCEYGHYGTECRQICGNCSGAGQCDRVTGECANGCMPGYHSALCNIGKLTTYLSHFTYFFQKYITPHCKLFIYIYIV